jgi:methyl-accepting chemotaxis protein
MATADQNRRTRYFIDKGFQGKYIALLVVFIVSLGIAGLLILVLGGGDAAGTKEGAADLHGAMIAMVLVTILFMAFTIWYGMRFSHRMVGPIYAIVRHLNWVQDGNYTHDLKLRDKDEFQNVAGVLNEMQKALRQRVRTDVEIMQRVETGLGELNEVLVQKDFDRDQAQELVKRLSKDIEAARVKNEGYITS